MTSVRRRAVALGPHELEVTHRPDGSILLRSPQPLGPYARCINDRVKHWAERTPERVCLAERAGEGWRRVTYAEVAAVVPRLAQGLLDQGCSPDHGVAILSENAIDHALLGLAAMEIGIPYAPISPPYALLSADFAKLRLVLSIFEPALIYVSDAERYERALTSDALPHVPVAASRLGGARAVIPFEQLAATTPTPAVAAASAAVGPDTIAKILFTSGSTGTPKGVINTQRMMCANQQMNLQTFPFFAGEMVMLDWSPWNHTAGGNQVVNMVFYNGGTLHIDDGKPTPAEMHKTIRNLREVAPTVYFNVPRGYEELVRAFEAERSLRETFFSRLQMMWYAGAALSAPTFDAMRRLAIETVGEEIMMTSGLGSTETAPSMTFANWYSHVSGNIGVPIPGVEAKLVPVGGKLEVRGRGPSITPGYLKRDDLTRAAFDEEGYYKLGDALRPVDPNDFSQGFLFDGRITEDFKLATGTWVSVGPLRTTLIARLQPVVRDVVLCAPDRDDLTALFVPDLTAARAHAGLAAAATEAEVVAHPALRAFVAERLAAFAAEFPGSSQHVERAIFLDVPPSIDAGEITDKGSLNNAAIRERRATLVERLYASEPDRDVIRAR